MTPEHERLLAAMVKRAAGLDERAAAGPLPTDMGAWIWGERWAMVVAHGAPDDFARRLAWDGWSRDQLGWLVAPLPPAPRWAGLLAELAAAEPLVGSEAPAAPIAFGPILAPAARVLADHVAAGAPAGWARLRPAARAALAESLLDRLLFIGEQVLATAWRDFRLAAGAPADAALAPPGRALHDAFVAGWRGPALLTALQPYPVLGRLWGVAIAQAIDEAIEVLGRLDADAAPIGAALGPAYEPVAVAGLRPRLSDPHHGGRTVWRLTMAGGGTLFYKPRPLAVDEAWRGLLAWLAQAGLGLDLRTPATLDRGAWGWVQGVEPQPLADAAAAGRFFRRMGALVAVAHALGANDLHFENVLAAGEHPVIIDLETLMPPCDDAIVTDLGPFAGRDARDVSERIFGGVFRSLLLTRPMRQDGGPPLDFGALADPVTVDTHLEACWLDVGTDRLRPGSRPTRPSGRHLARLDGRALRARDHLEDVLAGFDAAYGLLAGARERLLAPDGPLAAFADVPVRRVYRQSQHYHVLLTGSFAPDRLADGRERGIGLDLLVRSYLGEAERPAAWPVIGAERRALDQLDFPYLAGRAGSRDLVADGLVLPAALPHAPIAHARARIAVLGPTDHALQRAALALVLGRPRADRPPPGDPPPEPFDPLAAAVQLGERLAATAFPTADGGATWLARQPVPGYGEGVRALGSGLWDGTLGPALFLGALSAAASEPRFAALARAASLGARRAAADAAATTRADAAAAIGLAYGLARLAPYVDDPDLQARVRGLVAACDPAAIPDSDVVGGLAGALLALLAIHGLDGAAGALAQAARCGDALLARREPGPAGVLAWRSGPGGFTAGYGHGQAGIADALLRLDACVGGGRYRDAARDALATEATCFVPAAGDWRVVHDEAADPAAPRFPGGWCHGAPGMVLGRLAARTLAPAFAEELEVALAATVALPPQPADDLCCGMAGRIEAWLEAARVLGRPALAARAHAAARALPSRRPHGAIEDGDPRFLKGLSGIGWAFLRVADPTLPCLLAGR